MIKILGIPLVEKLLDCLVDICGPHNLSNSNVTQMDIMAVSLYFIFGFLLHSRHTQGWEAEETWRQSVLVDKLVFLLLSRAARLWEKTISVCSNQTSWLTARHSCYQSCADVDHGPVGWSLPVSTRDSHGQRVRGRRTGCRVHSFILYLVSEVWGRHFKNELPVGPPLACRVISRSPSLRRGLQWLSKQRFPGKCMYTSEKKQIREGPQVGHMVCGRFPVRPCVYIPLTPVGCSSMSACSPQNCIH